MSGNSFGKIFRVTSFGESHGEAIGCVVDGVPSNIELSEEYIQYFLNKRKPGASKITSTRKEEDVVHILSGVFNNKTIGTPISLLIFNEDQRSKDYDDIKNKFRPGHADYTYYMKYGIRDYRGGGRSSARETAMRVAAGSIARKIIGENIKFKSAITQIGSIKIDDNIMDWSKDDWDRIINNELYCPDKNICNQWLELIKSTRKNSDSLGAMIEIHIENVPVGLGEPIFDKIDADIAKAIMSIPAVKSVEIGAGSNVVELLGSQNVDQIGDDGFLSNNSGGILGGITTGQDIIVKFAVKPPSSISKNLQTIDEEFNNVNIRTIGRHDPCIGPRVVPVGEAMIACVLADHYLQRYGQKISGQKI